MVGGFVHKVIHSSVLLLLVTISSCQKCGHLIPPSSRHNETVDNNTLAPTVFIAVLARNKEHTLPYFLNLIENLDYPKERIAIWIKSDHNEDKTPEILRTWEREVGEWGQYHSVSVSVADGPPYRQSDQNASNVSWSPKRFQHIIRLKEEAIKVAQKIWADYIWFLDADVFIVNNQTLKHLVEKKKQLVAPMLTSGGMYSNFWGGMENYYYVRTEEYKEIIEYQKNGCFQVPLISCAVLMDVRKKNLSMFERFNESIPEDDMILFAENAKRLNMTMEVCNDLEYGYILAPLNDDSPMDLDFEQLANMRVEVATYWDPPLQPSPVLEKYVFPDVPPSTIGFDKIYLINLKRRKDRLIRMQNTMKILGIDYELAEAVDGLINIRILLMYQQVPRF